MIKSLWSELETLLYTGSQAWYVRGWWEWGLVGRRFGVQDNDGSEAWCAREWWEWGFVCKKVLVSDWLELCVANPSGSPCCAWDMPSCRQLLYAYSYRRGLFSLLVARLFVFVFIVPSLLLENRNLIQLIFSTKVWMESLFCHYDYLSLQYHTAGCWYAAINIMGAICLWLKCRKSDQIYGQHIMQPEKQVNAKNMNEV